MIVLFHIKAANTNKKKSEQSQVNFEEQYPAHVQYIGCLLWSLFVHVLGWGVNAFYHPLFILITRWLRLASAPSCSVGAELALTPDTICGSEY